MERNVLGVIESWKMSSEFFLTFVGDEIEIVESGELKNVIILEFWKDESMIMQLILQFFEITSI